MKTNTILSTAFFIFVLSVILSGCKENAYTVSTETVIHALVPDVAYPGDTVTLYGSNLGGHNASVKINGVEAAFVKGDEDKIVIVVPQTVSGDVVLKTSRGEFTLTNGLSVYGNVSIDSFYPAIVTTGTKLVIKGKGFDLQKLRSNVVRITPDQGETYAVHLQTESVTADSIVVIVDQKFDQGQISVAVGKFEAITTSDIRYLDLPRIDDTIREPAPFAEIPTPSSFVPSQYPPGQPTPTWSPPDPAWAPPDPAWALGRRADGLFDHADQGRADAEFADTETDQAGHGLGL